MTEVQKQKIVQAIELEEQRLGSANRVASKCGVSSATISQMKRRNWKLIRPEMWQKVAGALKVDFSEWVFTREVYNARLLFSVFNDAKDEHLFVAVSHKAGSGKTATAKHYAKLNAGKGVFYTQAREWAKREFLLNACQDLGIEIPKGVISIDKLGQKVIDFFNERAFQSPVWIIDEADKLKPAALRYLITFYNQLEDKAAMVILGTENLKKEIERGVRLNKKGYDEIASRFGRNFVSLIGATLNDIRKISTANGITDKNLQKQIFTESKPVQVKVENNGAPTFIKVVEDFRRVKRIIKRELIKQNQLQYETA